MTVCVLSCSAESDSLRPYGLQPARLLFPWNIPSQNIRMGCHFLLQRICPIQGLNPGLLPRQAGSLPLSCQEAQIDLQSQQNIQTTSQLNHYTRIKHKQEIRFLKNHKTTLQTSKCILKPKYNVYLLLLLLSCFSHIRLCATQQTAAHQAPTCLGFSR